MEDERPGIGPPGVTGGTVILLFTDLVDSTGLLERVGDEDAEGIFRAHFRLLHKAVVAHGGQEVKNLGDGLMVVLPSATEGVKCAVEIQRAVRDHNVRLSEDLHVRVGLHVGEPIRDDADYFGTPVTVAKRLCDRAAPDQILASGLVEALAQHRADVPFKPLGDFELKGLKKPVDVFEVDWDEPAATPWSVPRFSPPRRRTAFVGRERELDTLQSAWEKVKERTTQTVLLAGEPGVGKTRLVERFATSLPAGTVILWGRCQESSAIPYEPFLEVLRTYLGDRPPAEIRALLRSGSAELALLLPQLAPFILEHPNTGQLDPETQRYRLFEAVADVVRHACGIGPVLLVLEDMHWADKPTVLMLRHILRDTEKCHLLLVCTYRDVELARSHPFGQAVIDLRREHAAERARLEGLGRDDVATLVALWADANAPPRLVDAVWAETEGNALFVEEVLLHLAEAVPEWDGAFSSEGIFDATTIPQGIREAVEHRLRRLSEIAERMLVVASVVGREFSLDLVARAGEFGEDDVLEAAEEATSRGLISESPDQALGVYRFAHALMHRAVYDKLSTLRRVRIHARVGRAIEELFADSIEEHLSELAFHFGEAAADGDLDKAVIYSAWAGARAVEVVAYEEGAAHFARALQLLDSQQRGLQTQRLELVMRLGQAQLKAGDIASGRATLLEAAALAREQADPQALGRVALCYGGDVWRFGYTVNDPTMLKLLQEALDVIGPDDSKLRVRLLARTAAELYYARDIERRARLTDEALQMAGRIGDRRLELIAAESSLLTRLGPDLEPERALAEAAGIIRGAEDNGDFAMAIRAQHLRLSALVASGDLAGADAEADQSDSLARRQRMPGFTFWVEVYRAMRALLAGDFDSGAELASMALANGLATDEATATANYGAQLVYERWARGRLTETEAIVARYVEDFPRFPAYMCALAFVRAQLERGDAAEPFEHFAGANFETLPRDDNWLMGMWLLSFACAFLEDRERAEQLYEMLLPFQHRITVLGTAAVCTGSMHTSLGALARTAGAHDAAARHFEAAIETNRALGAPPLVAYAQYEYARLLEHRCSERTARLCADATDIANRHGMGWLAEKCDALRRREPTRLFQSQEAT